MFHVIPKRVIFQSAVRISSRAFSQQQSPAGSAGSAQKPMDTNVPGLSDNCVKIGQNLGPNAAKDKEYKNPEYFSYHVDSFGEAEVEIAKYRLPAPSNKIPFNK